MYVQCISRSESPTQNVHRTFTLCVAAVIKVSLPSAVVVFLNGGPAVSSVPVGNVEEGDDEEDNGTQAQADKSCADHGRCFNWQVILRHLWKGITKLING